jgi:hypothetical protein
MSTPNIAWGIVSVLRAAETIIEDVVPLYLARLSDDYPDLDMPDAIEEITRSSEIVSLGDTPHVQIYEESSTVVESLGLGAYDVEHTIVARLLMTCSADTDTVSLYSDRRRVVAHAIAEAVTWHLPQSLYGGASGVYAAEPVGMSPEEFFEEADRGVWMSPVQIRMTVRQRVLFGPLPPE